MSNPFSDYKVHGPAEPRRARAAALIDLAIGAFLAILAWPFPVMRIVLTDATGSVAFGWVAHVLLLLASVAVADGLYTGVITLVVKRTAGMYLQDLGFREPVIGWARASAIAPGWVVAGVAGIFGAVGPAGGIAAELLGTTRSSG